MIEKLMLGDPIPAEGVQSCPAYSGNKKDFSGPHVGNSSVKYFLVDLKARKRLGNAERPRCYTRTTKVKLWEEPDRKLVTDDVCGGGCSFWAE